MANVVVVAVAALMAIAIPAEANDCSIADARARATELLGHEPQTTIDISASGATATLTIDGSGHRTIVARDCRELVEAIALVIVMNEREERAEPEPAPIPLRPTPRKDPLAERVTERSPRYAPTLEAGAIAAAALGLSSLDFDQRVTLGVRVRRNQLSLDTLASVHRTDQIALAQGSITVALTSFALAPCVHVGALAFCGTASGGWFTGRGNDLYEGTTEQLTFLALGARVGYEWQVARHLALALDIDVDVPLLTSRFLVDQMPVWTNRRIEAWSGAAAIVSIP